MLPMNHLKMHKRWVNSYKKAAAIEAGAAEAEPQRQSHKYRATEAGAAKAVATSQSKELILRFPQKNKHKRAVGATLQLFLFVAHA